MTVELECLYCGKKWEKIVYSKQSIEDEKCSKCGDSHLKVKDINTTKIDYYVGCPPFPEKILKDPGWPYGSGRLNYPGNTDY